MQTSPPRQSWLVQVWRNALARFSRKSARTDAYALQAPPPSAADPAQELRRTTKRFAPGTKPAILIVDDSDIVLDFVSSALQPDYTVTTAKSDRAALALIHSGLVFDLIISDTHFEPGNGIAFMHTVHRSHLDIPFIGMSHTDRTHEWSTSGAIGFWRKGPNAQKLLELLRAQFTIEI